jgi:hypothetical protein
MLPPLSINPIYNQKHCFPYIEARKIKKGKYFCSRRIIYSQYCKDLENQGAINGKNTRLFCCSLILENHGTIKGKNTRFFLL